jgi:DNA-binding Xre family transcriptional regulator
MQKVKWVFDAVAYFAPKSDDTEMENVSTVANESEILGAIGGAIRRIRKSRGISQEDLAYLCRIDRSHMGRIERGERNLAILNFVRICQALACSPSELLAQAGY